MGVTPARMNLQPSGICIVVLCARPKYLLTAPAHSRTCVSLASFHLTEHVLKSGKRIASCLPPPVHAHLPILIVLSAEPVLLCHLTGTVGQVPQRPHSTAEAPASCAPMGARPRPFCC